FVESDVGSHPTAPLAAGVRPASRTARVPVPALASPGVRFVAAGLAHVVPATSPVRVAAAGVGGVARLAPRAPSPALPVATAQYRLPTGSGRPNATVLVRPTGTG